jgi:hypothetical protein
MCIPTQWGCTFQQNEVRKGAEVGTQIEIWHGGRDRKFNNSFNEILDGQADPFAGYPPRQGLFFEIKKSKT